MYKSSHLNQGKELRNRGEIRHTLKNSRSCSIIAQLFSLMVHII